MRWQYNDITNCSTGKEASPESAFPALGVAGAEAPPPPPPHPLSLGTGPREVICPCSPGGSPGTSSSLSSGFSSQVISPNVDNLRIADFPVSVCMSHIF